jgi:hypothetical protein
MIRLLMISTIILMFAVAGAAQMPLSNDKDQITEVTLERTACYGSCPIYKVTLRRDGTISYKGEEFVELKGAYEGKVYGFERLAQLILSNGYFSLKNNYTINATDLPSTITTVVSGGKRKTVTNYGDTGPIELWGIEMAIDGMWKGAKLEKAKGQQLSPRK